MPQATTFGRVLAAVDGTALQRALTGGVLARRKSRPWQRADGAQARGQARTVLTFDDKTMRRASEVFSPTLAP